MRLKPQNYRMSEIHPEVYIYIATEYPNNIAANSIDSYGNR